jgi:hypothetical protein
MLTDERRALVVKIHKALHKGKGYPKPPEGWRMATSTVGGELKLRKVMYIQVKGGGSLQLLQQNPAKQTGKWWQAEAAKGKKVTQVQYRFRRPDGEFPRYNMGAGVVVDDKYTEYEKKGKK